MATVTSRQGCSEALFLHKITVTFLQTFRKCQFRSRTSEESRINNDSADMLSVRKYCHLFTHELSTLLFLKMHSAMHSYAPSKLMGRKNLQNSPSPWQMWTHLIHPSHGRPHSPPQTASRSKKPFSTIRLPDKPTDRRPTDRPTNGLR